MRSLPGARLVPCPARRRANSADADSISATVTTQNAFVTRGRATQALTIRLRFHEKGPRPDPTTICPRAFLIKRNCKASRLRRERLGSRKRQSSDNFAELWRRSHAPCRGGFGISAGQPPDYLSRPRTSAKSRARPAVAAIRLQAALGGGLAPAWLSAIGRVLV